MFKIPTRFRLPLRFASARVPQGGEANASSNKTSFDLENHQAHRTFGSLPTSSPCGIWEGRGLGSSFCGI